MVIAAHPDDELIGCAGRIAKHVENGDVVKILIMAEGSTSRSETRLVKQHQSKIDILQGAAKRAAQILGVEQISFAGFPDNRMDECALLDIIKVIEKEVSLFGPSIVYTHHPEDLNIDHGVTHRAVLTACRPIGEDNQIQLMAYETLSSTEWNAPNASIQFSPNIFVNIELQWEKKLAALREYQSEMRDFPHPRSLEAIEALAKVRGSTCSFKYAEAFSLIRKVIS